MKKIILLLAVLCMYQKMNGSSSDDFAQLMLALRIGMGNHGNPIVIGGGQTVWDQFVQPTAQSASQKLSPNGAHAASAQDEASPEEYTTVLLVDPDATPSPRPSGSPKTMLLPIKPKSGTGTPISEGVIHSPKLSPHVRDAAQQFTDILITARQRLKHVSPKR